MVAALGRHVEGKRASALLPSCDTIDVCTAIACLLVSSGKYKNKEQRRELTRETNIAQPVCGIQGIRSRILRNNANREELRPTHGFRSIATANCELEIRLRS